MYKTIALLSKYYLSVIYANYEHAQCINNNPKSINLNLLYEYMFDVSF